MFKLIQTSGACPEQYNVFLGNECVGYMRLRHGYFRAECHEETVYESEPQGDGGFEPDERQFYLTKACKAIKKRLKETGRLPAEQLYQIDAVTED